MYNANDIRLIYEQYKGLSDGLAKKKNVSEDNVCPYELALGVEVEQEHTNDPKLAKQIALDHLAEDPEYYTKLKKVGL